MSSAKKDQPAQSSINFEALEQLLRGGSRKEVDGAVSLDDIRIHNSYQFEPRRSSSNQHQRVTLYSSTSKITRQGRTFRDLQDRMDEIQDIFADPKITWWLDMQSPSESDLRLLCSALGVHPLTIEDILNRETREKIEDYQTYYFACIWSTQGLEQKFETAYKAYSTYAVVFPSGTLTISFIESGHPERVLRRIEKLEDHLSLDSDWIFYAFMDDIVDSFYPLIARIEKRVEEIEDQVYTTRQDNIQEFLFGIKTARKNVSSLTRLLYGKLGILPVFEKRCSDRKLPSMSEDTSQNLELYIKDVQDHVITFVSNLIQFDSLLSRSQSNFLAALSIETVQTRRTLNTLLGQVTVFTMIFTTLNLICGMFSTNVNAHVTFYTSNEPVAWFVIVTAEVILAVVLWYTARRYKWC